MHKINCTLKGIIIHQKENGQAPVLNQRPRYKKESDLVKPVILVHFKMHIEGDHNSLNGNLANPNLKSRTKAPKGNGSR